MSEILTIEYLSVSSLSSHSSNPRKHPKAQIKQIAESIKTFGFKAPVLVDALNRLICGHGRIEACRTLGIEKVPVIRVEDLNEAKIRAYMIADNRLTEAATWDQALLAENFKFLTEEELDFSIDVTGFDYGDIENFMRDDEAPSADEPPVPDSDSIVAVARPDDLWNLGDHRILCGDSLSPSCYEQLFGGGKAAAIVFTDPPYNLPARDIGQTCESTHGDFAMGSGEMSSEQFTRFLAGVFQNLQKHSVDGSIHYICMDWRHVGELLAAGSQVYDELKNLCVWAKSSGGMGTFYRSQHELVFVFKSGRGKHQNNFKLGQHGRYRSNLWSYPSVMHLKSEDGDKGGREALSLHPTIKPVALIEDVLLDCSQRNEIVLDAFLGSGSTLIAAEKTGRVCYGIELSPRYVDVAITRWQEWTGLEAVNAASGCTYNELKMLA